MTDGIARQLAQEEEYRVRTEPKTLDGLWDEMYRAIRDNRDGKLMISLRGRIEAEAALLARPVERDYEARVTAMADALHEDCRLEWQAIRVVDPTRMVTQHGPDHHYGQAHDLVRRLGGME